ncbi:hypothetical protein CXG81DRAFT_26301 [Caulochytrium protostelioides]|uniref:Uncharacterized protein n=1 Tax=Caulochytrium protostelioides TaxID=1555241 RepID=A0A4P9X6Z8_9FUNG|nr:hypothetical protein CXG81DRAFT_26301 [Caulochytrium protostelioides]|eukprot:RKP00997.1 hypothetical protein CXG81DRAFT_26301 [Caulochytrium protostelioides]
MADASGTAAAAATPPRRARQRLADFYNVDPAGGATAAGASSGGGGGGGAPSGSMTPRSAVPTAAAVSGAAAIDAATPRAQGASRASAATRAPRPPPISGSVLRANRSASGSSQSGTGTGTGGRGVSAFVPGLGFMGALPQQMARGVVDGLGLPFRLTGSMVAGVSGRRGPSGTGAGGTGGGRSRAGSRVSSAGLHRASRRDLLASSMSPAVGMMSAAALPTPTSALMGMSMADLTAVAAAAATAGLLDLDSPTFSQEQALAHWLSDASIAGLLERDTQLVTDLRRLDTEMKGLVYTNYSKFVNATTRIARMRDTVGSLGATLQQLQTRVATMTELTSANDAALREPRQAALKLAGVHALLDQLNFIFELPSKMKLCLAKRQYLRLVRYHTRTIMILEHFSSVSLFHTIGAECRELTRRAQRALQTRLSSGTLDLAGTVECTGLLLGLGEADASGVGGGARLPGAATTVPATTAGTTLREASSSHRRSVTDLADKYLVRVRSCAAESTQQLQSLIGGCGTGPLADRRDAVERLRVFLVDTYLPEWMLAFESFAVLFLGIPLPVGQEGHAVYEFAVAPAAAAAADGGADGADGTGAPSQAQLQALAHLATWWEPAFFEALDVFDQASMHSSSPPAGLHGSAVPRAELAAANVNAFVMPIAQLCETVYGPLLQRLAGRDLFEAGTQLRARLTGLALLHVDHQADAPLLRIGATFVAESRGATKALLDAVRTKRHTVAMLERIEAMPAALAQTLAAESAAMLDSLTAAFAPLAPHAASFDAVQAAEMISASVPSASAATSFALAATSASASLRHLYRQVPAYQPMEMDDVLQNYLVTRTAGAAGVEGGDAYALAAPPTAGGTARGTAAAGGVTASTSVAAGGLAGMAAASTALLRLGGSHADDVDAASIHLGARGGTADGAAGLPPPPLTRSWLADALGTRTAAFWSDVRNALLRYVPGRGDALLVDALLAQQVVRAGIEAETQLEATRRGRAGALTAGTAAHGAHRSGDATDAAGADAVDAAAADAEGPDAAEAPRSIVTVDAAAVAAAQRATLQGFLGRYVRERVRQWTAALAADWLASLPCTEAQQWEAPYEVSPVMVRVMRELVSAIRVAAWVYPFLRDAASATTASPLSAGGSGFGTQTGAASATSTGSGHSASTPLAITAGALGLDSILGIMPGSLADVPASSGLSAAATASSTSAAAGSAAAASTSTSTAAAAGMGVGRSGHSGAPADAATARFQTLMQNADRLFGERVDYAVADVVPDVIGVTDALVRLLAKDALELVRDRPRATIRIAWQVQVDAAFVASVLATHVVPVWASAVRERRGAGGRPPTGAAASTSMPTLSGDQVDRAQAAYKVARHLLDGWVSSIETRVARPHSTDGVPSLEPRLILTLIGQAQL